MIPCANYVITLGENLQKVGISAQPNIRAKDFGRSAKVVFQSMTTRQDARAAERLAHRSLAYAALGGERFAVPAEVAIAAVKEAQENVKSGIGLEVLVTFGLTLPPVMVDNLRATASQSRCSMSDVVSYALEQLLGEAA